MAQQPPACTPMTSIHPQLNFFTTLSIFAVHLHLVHQILVNSLFKVVGGGEVVGVVAPLTPCLHTYDVHSSSIEFF